MAKQEKIKSRKVPSKKKPMLAQRLGLILNRVQNRSRGPRLSKKLIYSGIVMSLLGIGGVSWYEQYPQKIWSLMGQKGLQLTADLGFKVRDIMVEGRQYTTNNKLLDAIQLKRGDPIFTYTPSEIRDHLKEVPWIEEAEVLRNLPDSLYIKIVERIPIAIWQHHQKHYLVDKHGVVLTDENLSTFSKLPIIVGGDAPLHVPKMLDCLKKFPLIYPKVTALIRIGGRRWDLQLNQQVTIKLPEEQVETALNKLSMLLEKKKLDLHELKSIDLRIPKKTIINVAPHGNIRLRGKGKEA